MKRSQAAALIDQLREMAALTDRTYTATELGGLLAQFNVAPLEVCTGEAHSNAFIDNCMYGMRSSLGFRWSSREGHMTRLEHSAELVGDIRDCAMRARDLGFTADSVDLCKTADQIEFRLTRDSLPPVLASNQAARATASKHFQEARRLLKGLK